MDSLTVTAIFKTRLAAQNAIHRLEDAGITDKQISLVMSDETRGKDFARFDDGDNSDEGAAAGATAGAILGALMGAVSLAGVIAMPGINLIVAGPALGALAGLATGAGAGGIIGALIGAGLSETDASDYEAEIKSGSILLAVRAKDEAQRDQVEAILRDNDASNLSAFAASDAGRNVRPSI